MIGDIAESYLRKFTTKAEADRTYGLYDKDSKLYIGDKKVDIKENNIVVDGEEEYEGTPGLWELIVSKNLDETIHNDEDKAKYKKLMIKTNALYRKNNKKKTHPKSSRSTKWVKILSEIWENRKKV